VLSLVLSAVSAVSVVLPAVSIVPKPLYKCLNLLILKEGIRGNIRSAVMLDMCLAICGVLPSVIPGDT